MKKKEENLIEEINKSVMQSKTLSESMELGRRRQEYAKRQRKKRERQESEEEEEPRTVQRKKSKPQPHKESAPKKVVKIESDTSVLQVGFVLLCHPNERKLEQLTNRYLRTSNQLTIRHLCKFLAKKFHEPDYKVFKISTKDQKDLDDHLTLSYIFKLIGTEELTLLYRLSPKE